VTIDTLGGYRLVRRLGQGPRAEVFLAHPERDDSDAEPAVLKLYRVDVGDDSIGREAEAVFRAAGQHVVELLDLTVSPDGSPVLIMQRLSGTSLGRLLSEREELDPGEAITILAPLAIALRRIHDSGVAHGAIRPDAVLFDAAGAPVLTSFGSATLFARGLPIARLDAEPAALADLAGFAALASLVLDRVAADTSRLTDLLVTIVDHSTLALFADALFDWEGAKAVRLNPGPLARAEHVPGRMVKGTPIAAPERVGLLGRLVPEVDRLLGDAGATELTRRVRTALIRVRARVWLAAGAALIALIAAIVLVPQGSSDAVTDGDAIAVAPMAQADPATDDVTSDDPIAAALALLRSREWCVDELSVSCLDGVDQQGSAALSLDRELIVALQNGTGELPSSMDVVSVDLKLVERLGDTALVTLGGGVETTPASLLLMKGEAGWRIRDYLE
jgi:hypothetical protein